MKGDDSDIKRFNVWCASLGKASKAQGKGDERNERNEFEGTLKVRVFRSEDPGLGCGLLATQPIAAGEVVSVPVGCVLTLPAAARSVVGQALLRRLEGQGRVSAQALMYLVMIHGRHEASSAWHEYLRQIPWRHGDPLWWAPGERRQRLAGTQLLHDADRHEAQLRAVHGALFPALSREMPHLFPEETWKTQEEKKEQERARKRARPGALWLRGLLLGALRPGLPVLLAARLA
ncbi:unnamed protein product [Effrenium voratum]|nr:unnamed protein product [Effrenium voratum]